MLKSVSPHTTPRMSEKQAIHITTKQGDPSGCDGGVAEGSSLFRWPPGYHHLAAPPTKAQMHAVYTRASESQNIRIASHGPGPTTAQMQI